MYPDNGAFRADIGIHWGTPGLFSGKITLLPTVT